MSNQEETPCEVEPTQAGEIVSQLVGNESVSLHELEGGRAQREV